MVCKGFSQNYFDGIPYTYTVNSVALGLNSSDIYSLYQDQDGFIWVGTKSGISRYNGNNFKNFTNSVSSPLGKINSIGLDDDGTLWIAGTNGLFYLDKGEFYQSKLNYKNILTLHFNKGNLIVGGDGFVPITLSSSQILRLKNNETVIPNSIVSADEWIGTIGKLLVRDIDVDDEGNLWFAVYNKRASFDGENLIVHWQGKEEIHDYGEVKVIGKDSIIWGSEDSGMFLQHQGKFQKLTEAVTYIFAESQAGTYALTSQRLVKLRNNKLFTEHFFSDYANLYFKEMLVDKEGNIWIGAEGNLLKLTKNYLRKWTFKNDSLLHSTHSITKLCDGTIAIGSSKERILAINDNLIATYTTIDVPHNSFTSDIICDDIGNIWYATSMGGLIRQTNDTKINYSENQGLGDKGQYFLQKDKYGQLWSGGEYGITKISFDGDAIDFENYMVNNDAHELPIFRAVFHGPDDKIYAVGSQGLFIVKGKDLIPVNFTNQQIKGTIITNAIVYRNNMVWLSTQGDGLFQCRFDANNELQIVKKWGTADGLSNNVILDILIDKNERLWIANQNGLCYLNLLEEFDLQRCFTAIDGWFSEPTPHCKLVEGDNGFLWAAGLTEVCAIPTSEIPINAVKPETYISGVEFIDGNDNIYDYSDKPAIRHKLPNNLTLPYHKNSLRFHFGTTSYTKPEKISFVYNLSGLDNKWNSSIDNSQIIFSGLEPGNYILNMTAINNDGIRDNSPAQYAFTINPPWYQSFWFLALALVLILLIIYTIFSLQLNKNLLEREKIQLEEVTELKTNFYSNITHELKTPLTVIMGITKSLKKKLAMNNTLYDHDLEVVERNGQELLQLIDKMLGISKIESGYFNMKMLDSDFIVFIKYVVESFNYLAKEKKINLELKTQIEHFNFSFDKDVMNTILSNLISNAIKFTSENGNVIVEVEKNQDSLLILVEDDGIGISEDDQPRIFERYFQSHENPKDKIGNGIGLSLTKSLIDKLGGTITVASQLNSGTTFTINIPVMAKEILKQENSFLTRDEIEESKMSILIIDDNKDVRYYLRGILQPEYVVIEAENGEEGIELARNNLPDLVISDIMMPGINGIQVCNTLKNYDLTDHIPVIILTAKGRIDDRIEGISSGADAYITKPFSELELTTRIKSLIDQRSKLIEKFKKDEEQLIEKYSILKPSSNFLIKANKSIETNLDNPDYGLHDLSDSLYLSESQVYRKIKALTGKSTAVYIRSYRLNRSMQMIKSEDLSVSEIAYSTGFNDPSWFSRAFKEEFGKSPSDYK